MMRNWTDVVLVQAHVSASTVQKLSVDLEPLQKVLQSLTGVITFKKTGKLEDTYWAVMKLFGVM